jgi:hypothetical protein
LATRVRKLRSSLERVISLVMQFMFTESAKNARPLFVFGIVFRRFIS